jgi:hypothetical protein
MTILQTLEKRLAIGPRTSQVIEALVIKAYVMSSVLYQ